MLIYSYLKTSLSDYPGKISTIIFTSGCNLSCKYCHNSLLINKESGSSLEEELLAFLNKRKNQLDGVVISGGEPLVWFKTLKEFIKKIKAMGLLIKLDSNGTNSHKLQELLSENLLDYVALDFKSDRSSWELVTGLRNGYDQVLDSINLVNYYQVEYELRTTLIQEIHTRQVWENMLSDIPLCSKLILQTYIPENSWHKDFKHMHKISDQNLGWYIEKAKKKAAVVLTR